MFLTGCLEPSRAYDELDGQVLVLLAAMIPLGLALQDTGAAAATADFLLGFLEPPGPPGALAGVYVLTTIVTSVISNAATAVVLTPIAVSLATSSSVMNAPASSARRSAAVSARPTGLRSARCTAES